MLYVADSEDHSVRATHRFDEFCHEEFNEIKLTPISAFVLCKDYDMRLGVNQQEYKKKAALIDLQSSKARKFLSQYYREDSDQKVKTCFYTMFSEKPLERDNTEVEKCEDKFGIDISTYDYYFCLGDFCL